MEFPLISHCNSVFQHSEEARCFWVSPAMLYSIGNYFKLAFCPCVYFCKILQFFFEMQMFALCDCSRNREWAASRVYLVLWRLWVTSCYLRKVRMRQCAEVCVCFESNYKYEKLPNLKSFLLQLFLYNYLFCVFHQHINYNPKTCRILYSQLAPKDSANRLASEDFFFF